MSSTEQAAALLRRKGIKDTPQRVFVVAELAKVPNDTTAQQLYDRMRRKGITIGVATVYRTLSLLHQHGAVDTFAHHAGELCYRLCGEEHHHHLFCTKCHRVVEIEDCDLDAWVAKSAKRHGFTATRHDLEIEGVCAGCRAA